MLFNSKIFQIYFNPFRSRKFNFLHCCNWIQFVDGPVASNSSHFYACRCLYPPKEAITRQYMIINNITPQLQFFFLFLPPGNVINTPPNPIFNSAVNKRDPVYESVQPMFKTLVADILQEQPTSSAEEDLRKLSCNAYPSSTCTSALRDCYINFPFQRVDSVKFKGTITYSAIFIR